MNKEQKIQFLKDLNAGIVAIGDLMPMQLNVFIEADVTILKIENAIVSEQEWAEQWKKQYKIGCVEAGKYLHVFVSGRKRF